MNNRGIKLFSILVIFLFCLSPLGAIGLNQGDNATHVNDNNTNNTEIKDINDTIKVNEVVDLDNDKSNVESQNITLNDSNSSLNSKGHDIGLHASISDCDYGQSPVLKIWCTSDAFGQSYFDVFVTGPGYSENFTKDIYSKSAEFKLSDNLTPGRYNVTVVFMGYPYGEKSTYFDDAEVTTSFTVKKLKVRLHALMDDIELGQSPTIHISYEKGLTGKITISSNFSDEKYPCDAAEHNSFTCHFYDKPNPGSYYCLVSYSGDDYHDSAATLCFFKVNKHDPNFTIQTGDIVEGDKILVKFQADWSLNCNVNYTVLPVPSTSSDSSSKLGTMHTIKLVNGKANATLDNSLGPGKYFISANCEGDDSYRSSSASAEFKVNPA